MKRQFLLSRLLLLFALIVGSGSAWAEQVTISYSGSTTNMDGSNQAGILGLTATDWSVVGTKNNASNNVGLNTDGTLRLYYNASGSNTLRVSSLKNATINSIEITYATGYTNGKITVGSNVITGSTSEGITTYTIGASSFVITNGNTSNTQVRFSKIKINYTPAAVKVTSISLNKTSMTLAVDKEETLTPTITPNNATDKTVTWSSSDDAIASVDSDGKVTAVAVGGPVTITATAHDGSGVTATCAVTVVGAIVPVNSVTLNKAETTITIGENETLTATISPNDATNKTVSWSSSNESVATVEDGVVTAKAVGTATITVTTTDGEKTATCEVTVTAKNTKPSLINTVFYESFNKCDGTGGNEEPFSNGSGDEIASSNLDNTWATTTNTYAANKCARVGTSKNGVLKTSNISLTGDATLTFRAAGWSGSATNSYTIAATNCTLSGDTQITTTNAEWNDYTVNITGATGTITVTFTGKRGFIDEVKIVQTKTSVDVTLNASGFASYCSPFALDLTPTSDYAAYAVKTIGENKVKFTKIPGKVAANTPFILYNIDKANKTVKLPIIDDDDVEIAAVSDNALIGTLSPTYVSAPSGYTNFGMSGSKFVPMNNGVVRANKAYLQVDNDDITTESGSSRSLQVIFDEETTGISNVEITKPEVKDNVYYNLNGQRVANPSKGLYIVNGKKVIINK